MWEEWTKHEFTLDKCRTVRLKLCKTANEVTTKQDNNHTPKKKNITRTGVGKEKIVSKMLQKITCDVILRVEFGHVLGNAFLQSKVVVVSLVKMSSLANDNCFTRLRRRELGEMQIISLLCSLKTPLQIFVSKGSVSWPSHLTRAFDCDSWRGERVKSPCLASWYSSLVF